jgi:hypothetical protein
MNQLHENLRLALCFHIKRMSVMEESLKRMSEDYGRLVEENFILKEKLKIMGY